MALAMALPSIPEVSRERVNLDDGHSREFTPLDDDRLESIVSALAARSILKNW